ncbi:hypothetical protein NCAS_0B02820 [Naumovozyma castellii]|uniref:Septin-type G domain-containing protein n=1 Tax=Naumovozyma castellii TaxID=27288 RepID=G0VBP0_NAUCA|nr:hypothetical protein NCAS_0B02820 [Naumovozyma castellii CBS 4309]CCC68366.1 hypothetical protein NCAS_0B02820 [Naumovozyma castellii CBS 4309]
MEKVQSRPQTSINTDELRRRRESKKEIQFNLLLLGETGIGKTTFLNNLCNQVIENDNDTQVNVNPLSNNIETTTHVIKRTIKLKEKDGAPTICLNVTSFEGLGDCINNSSKVGKVRSMLIYNLNHFFNNEIRIKREINNGSQLDPRVHLCLYFLKGNGKGLKEFDIKVLQSLNGLVNLIPVIGKADLLAEEELYLNKFLILKDIRENDIEIFDFQDDKIEESLFLAENEEESTAQKPFGTKSIAEMVPFSIICSETEKRDDNNELYHTRNYPWGQVIIENKKVSEFIILKSIILGSHLQDFRDSTNNILYEGFRTKKLLNCTEIQDNKRCYGNTDKIETALKISLKQACGENEPKKPYKELVDKNRIIEAYQKIENLEKMTNNSTGNSSPTRVTLSS